MDNQESKLAMPDTAHSKLDHLQARMGYFFKNPRLLSQALTHLSACHEAGAGPENSYERLEFLGDSILNLAIAELVFGRFPHESEGILTKLKSFWVSGPVLAEFSDSLGIPAAVLMGAGESRDGRKNIKLKASAFEAVLGALYLDSGWKVPRDFIRSLFDRKMVLKGLEVLKLDYRSSLQEMRQKMGLQLPSYRTYPSQEGFESEISLDGKVVASGSGRSKKEAEQASAKAALESLSI